MLPTQLKSSIAGDEKASLETKNNLTSSAVLNIINPSEALLNYIHAKIVTDKYKLYGGSFTPLVVHMVSIFVKAKFFTKEEYEKNPLLISLFYKFAADFTRNVYRYKDIKNELVGLAEEARSLAQIDNMDKLITFFKQYSLKRDYIISFIKEKLKASGKAEFLNKLDLLWKNFDPKDIDPILSFLKEVESLISISELMSILPKEFSNSRLSYIHNEVYHYGYNAPVIGQSIEVQIGIQQSTLKKLEAAVEKKSEYNAVREFLNEQKENHYANQLIAKLEYKFSYAADLKCSNNDRKKGLSLINDWWLNAHMEDSKNLLNTILEISEQFEILPGSEVLELSIDNVKNFITSLKRSDAAMMFFRLILVVTGKEISALDLLAFEKTYFTQQELASLIANPQLSSEFSLLITIMQKHRQILADAYQPLLAADILKEANVRSEATFLNALSEMLSLDNKAPQKAQLTETQICNELVKPILRAMQEVQQKITALYTPLKEIPFFATLEVNTLFETVNSRNMWKDLPTAMACEKGLLEILQTLIQFGADLSQKSKYGMDMITLATHSKHRHIVQFLLANDKNLQLVSEKDAENGYRSTALVRAVADQKIVAEVLPRLIHQLEEAYKIPAEIISPWLLISMAANINAIIQTQVSIYANKELNILKFLSAKDNNKIAKIKEIFTVLIVTTLVEKTKELNVIKKYSDAEKELIIKEVIDNIVFKVAQLEKENNMPAILESKENVKDLLGYHQQINLAVLLSGNLTAALTAVAKQGSAELISYFAEKCCASSNSQHVFIEALPVMIQILIKENHLEVAKNILAIGASHNQLGKLCDIAFAYAINCGNHVFVKWLLETHSIHLQIKKEDGVIIVKLLEAYINCLPLLQYYIDLIKEEIEENLEPSWNFVFDNLPIDCKDDKLDLQRPESAIEVFQNNYVATLQVLIAAGINCHSVENYKVITDLLRNHANKGSVGEAFFKKVYSTFTKFALADAPLAAASSSEPSPGDAKREVQASLTGVQSAIQNTLAPMAALPNASNNDVVNNNLPEPNQESIATVVTALPVNTK